MSDDYVSMGDFFVPPAAPTVRKVAGWVPVTGEMLADAPDVSAALDEAIDRMLRPWRYPDRNPMPVFVLFPRVAPLTTWIDARRAA